MAFETSSYASSSLQQSVDAPKELLLVLSILNEKQQRQQHRHHHQLKQQQQLQQQKFQQHMELSQIELIYRAEGNANLVLALPQFKKVLRLPKIQQKQQTEPQYQETQYNQKHPKQHQHRQEQEQQQQEHEMNQQEPNKISTTGQQQTKNAVGILTMDHYVAYISIIRCLVGNEFVFEADIVAVPNPNDRDWINEHIKPYRPANRLDKEFGGHFGLLLPDATRLPAEFDILFSNLQSTKTALTATGITATSKCCCSTTSNNTFGKDTYAIEIKPKQGWLLPNDVNNLFDIKPTGPTEVASKTESEALKASTDKEYFTTTQNTPPAQTITMAAATATSIPTTTTPTKTIPSTAKTTGDDKISHSLYDMVDIRCRYCIMQFLKLKQQKINKRSLYCPMDLFSGVTDRMLSALHALFECPQNNLRLFKNGNLVFDDQLSRTSKIEDLFSSDKLQLIKHLLVTCLLREYGKEEEDEKTAGASEENDDEERQVNKQTKGNKDGDDDGGDGQPQSSGTFCKKQKITTMPATGATATTEVTKVKTTTTETLTTNIPTVIDTLTCSSTYSAVSPQQIIKAKEPCLPKNCVLQKILHLQLLAKISLQFMVDHDYASKKDKTYNILYDLLRKFSENHNQLNFSQLLPKEQYLLASTALDCSIMIAFREIENTDESSLSDNPHVVTVLGKSFLTKVTLLDLDPKPDTHFAKYCQQTKEIVDILRK